MYIIIPDPLMTSKKLGDEQIMYNNVKLYIILIRIKVIRIVRLN